jgi:hypothetical protein
MRVRLAGLVIGGIILTGLILSGAPAVTFPAGRTVTIIYTGDTRGWVEPCGCAEGVLGGLPRRATLLARLREQCPDALIVDAGALLASSSDPLKVPLIVERLAAMGYAAVNLGVADYPWRHQLGGQMTKHGLTGVSLDYAAVRGIGRQCVVKGGGPSAALRTGVRVGITGIAALPTGKQLAALRAVLSELRKSAELVVVLSAAGPADNLRLAREVGGMDLVIGQAPGKRPQLLRAGEVWLAAVTPEGGHVGKVTLTLGTPGIEAAHDLYALDERIPDDQPTLRAVQAYYDRVAAPAQHLARRDDGEGGLCAGFSLLVLPPRHLPQVGVHPACRGDSDAAGEGPRPRAGVPAVPLGVLPPHAEGAAGKGAAGGGGVRVMPRRGVRADPAPEQEGRRRQAGGEGMPRLPHPAAQPRLQLPPVQGKDPALVGRRPSRASSAGCTEGAAPHLSFPCARNGSTHRAVGFGCTGRDRSTPAPRPAVPPLE